MPRCEYSYYVTLLPCNQFHGGTELSHPWPPLRTATGPTWLVAAVRAAMMMSTRHVSYTYEGGLAEWWSVCPSYGPASRSFAVESNL